MVAEPANDRRVNGVVELVRRGLMRKKYAEHGDENRAASQQRAGPGTDGGSQERQTGPQLPIARGAPTG